MRIWICIIVCSVSLRWLALLFDIPFDGDMHAAEWSRMLRCVSSRLAADAEEAYLSRFPWDLSNLSVPFQLLELFAALCCLVVEHLCCEVYKLLHAAGRPHLGIRLILWRSFCLFSGGIHVPREDDDVSYNELLFDVLRFFE